MDSKAVARNSFFHSHQKHQSTKLRPTQWVKFARAKTLSLSLCARAHSIALQIDLFHNKKQRASAQRRIPYLSGTSRAADECGSLFIAIRAKRAIRIYARALGPRNLGRILIQLKADGAICMGGETSARLISPAYAHTSSAGNELAKWL
jgi:hypothetical protein